MERACSKTLGTKLSAEVVSFLILFSEFSTQYTADKYSKNKTFQKIWPFEIIVKKIGRPPYIDYTNGSMLFFWRSGRSKIFLFFRFLKIEDSISWVIHLFYKSLGATQPKAHYSKYKNF